MKIVHTSLIVAALGMAALASTPARADLIISCSGSGCSGQLNVTNALSMSNNIAVACASTCNFGNFTLGPLAMLGQNNPGAAGQYADIENLDVSTRGSGTLTLSFEETNITSAAMAQQFLMDFSGTLSGGITDTRTFYLNGTTFLGSCSGAGGGACSHDLSALESTGGTFSLTEDIVLHAGRAGGFLSSDDKIGPVAVPEPASLALLGAGLVALGGLRRRRKDAKSA